MIRVILISTFLIISCNKVASSSQVHSQSNSDQKYVWNLERDRLAVEGYDVVAYFSLPESSPAVKGKEEFSYLWQGATWHFSSQQNLNNFRANPTKYIPQYGAYCAYAAARNYLYSIDPDAWTVRNGKLYLNATKGVRRQWLGNVERDIRRADTNWPNLKKKAS